MITRSVYGEQMIDCIDIIRVNPVSSTKHLLIRLTLMVGCCHKMRFIRLTSALDSNV